MLQETCKYCQGKHRSEECFRITEACFKCGEMGHRIKDCPKLTADDKDKGKGTTSTTGGRVFALTTDM
ncbi:hypothetical protein HA378_28970, partial [Escherichia coli]|nr:hypothetical protein [Escherichia coli]